MPADTIYLFDVDNTLLDNDQVTQDLRRHLEQNCGAGCARQYFDIFEQLRNELGYADYLGALQRYRLQNPRDLQILAISSFLIDYPFAERLYPGALECVRHCAPAVILSDGDAVFQPRKIERSGLWNAVEGRVLVYVHKEEMLDDVERRYPAQSYVMVDDKLRILTAMKRVWGARLTTVWVVQGHYANDPKVTTQYPPADVRIERIADLAATAKSAPSGFRS
jgi:FMN phosphatase YigB (HAD superfamily)